jgi:hypothetical protein
VEWGGGAVWETKGVSPHSMVTDVAVVLNIEAGPGFDGGASIKLYIYICYLYVMNK